jgi:hypothetical protein
MSLRDISPDGMTGYAREWATGGVHKLSCIQRQRPRLQHCGFRKSRFVDFLG